MEYRSESHDLVVCGGGLAGVCAAVSAARLGARVVLVQDRPVLGGNSSSEVRVVPRGSTTYHAYAREGGVLAEAMALERARNHEPIFENGWTNSVWDLVLYDLCQRTPGLTLHLNTAVHSVTVTDGRIQSIDCLVANAELMLTITGQVFVDATGDGLVADRAGCESRSGTEGRDEFDEPHATPEASADTMGNSLHFKTVDVGRPVDFELPEWAHSYDDPEFFYTGGRRPHDLRGGFWWIELGKPWHTIHDNEVLRHELTRHALGVWDWMKNKDPETAPRLRNHALDWLGQVPGKRESRRIMGLQLMTEHDLLADDGPDDEVAYGGWNVDLHTPGGLLADTSEPTAAAGYVLTGEASVRAYVGPFGIPLRSLIARDVDNLFMAGRNISATHVALGSVRVQATTALMGQAVGTAAAVALRDRVAIHDLPTQAIDTVQQQLLRDGVFLPHVDHNDTADLARGAEVTGSSERSHAGSTVPGKPDPREALAQRRAQWLPVVGSSSDVLTRVEMLLVNAGTSAVDVPVRLSLADHIWDYRITDDAVLSSQTVVVPPGEHWIGWDVQVGSDAVGLSPGQVGYVRLEVGPSEDVSWRGAAEVAHGAVSAFEMTPGRMRRFADGVTMCHRVEPVQPCHPPQAVVTGADRPHRAPNAWFAAADDPAPTVTLTWREPVAIETVQVTFPGNVFREYDRTPPLTVASGTAVAYTIEALVDDHWRTVVEVDDNVLTRVRHRVDPVTMSAIRLRIDRTGGDPAGVCEVRAWGPGVIP